MKEKSLVIEYQYFGAFNYNKILFSSTNIVFDIYEKYQKSSFRNQMELPGANGVLQLSVPILGGRDFKGYMAEVKIDHREAWRQKHLKAITSIYKNSPWFEYYEKPIYELFQQEYDLLWQWNKACINWVAKVLKVTAVMSENSLTNNLVDLEQRNDVRGKFAKKEQPMDTELHVKYDQVFAERIGFKYNMCVLDLIFCEGPAASRILRV